MSKIGKKPIEIPKEVEVILEEKGGIQEIIVKGPKGMLKKEIHPLIKVEKENNLIKVKPLKKGKKVSAFWGTERALIANMIEGVKNGYSKELEIHGIGYRAELKNDELILHLGFSHPVVYKIPEDIQIKVEKNTIIVSGIDKQKVGQVAAEIRAFKKPEPYKGKGIRYKGEVVRKKVGKKAIGAKQ